VAKAHSPIHPGRRVVGLSTDIGMPDGANLGLIVAPFSWTRLGASVGTNSASLGYRGSLSLIPMGWGPSFTFEAGHCNLANTNGVLRTFFSVPTWVEPYVQQIGYTYLNAHVGFDYSFGGVTVFVHGGYSYLAATLRSPQPVVIESVTNTTVAFTRDGDVQAYTWSAKLGLHYMFGGS
jgi:hypothetical protein